MILTGKEDIFTVCTFCDICVVQWVKNYEGRIYIMDENNNKQVVRNTEKIENAKVQAPIEEQVLGSG